MKRFFEVLNATFSSNKEHNVRKINFNIANKGEITCLLGPSGVGKTTILRTIAGLERLKSGEIWLDGKGA